ncbi:MAG: chemotaxis protein CheW [Pyrinomonadaceae bacterium]
MPLDNLPSSAGPSQASADDERSTKDSVAETTHKFVSFYLGETHYAVPARAVAEVTGHLTPTPLPDGPASLFGIAPYRGDILAIVDIGASPGSIDPAKRKAVVLRPIGDEVELPVAFNVDRIGEMLQVRAEDVRYTSSTDSFSEYQTSIQGKPVFLVDPSRIVDLLSL